MGKKITQLFSASTPLTGNELLLMVQNGSSVNTPLSTFDDRYSTDSEFGALSANFALKDTNNDFTASQTIYGSVTASSFGLSGTDIAFRKFSTNSLGVTNSSTLTGIGLTVIGYNAGIMGGDASRSNIIGSDAGYGAGSSSGNATNSNIIGSYAGYLLGYNGNAAKSNIIGSSAGYGAGSSSGTASYSNIIGSSAGYSSGADAGDASYSNIVGADAGYNAGATSGNVSYSNIIGYNAGRLIGSTSGSSSYANIIGTNAGYQAGATSGNVSRSNIIGSDAGYGAGSSSGTAEESNIIGSSAGYNVGATSGNASYSNIIGYQAGYSAGSNGGNSSYCNMIGHNAGTAVADGAGTNVSYSNIIGSNAGNFHNNAAYSNMIGYKSGGGDGVKYGSAINLIAIGSFAGHDAAQPTGTNIDESIYIGLSAGMNQTARKNIFIGSDTNTTTPAVSSLSGCIAVGYGAKPSAPNTIALGSTTVPLSTIPGATLTSSVSGLKIMVNGTYFTIPLLA